ncbi:MAG: penicillin-binding protein 1C [Bdellovibrionales bacterium]|nr:penicillin-binding protein 1C [Bdellovibrionales bacterium]
MRSKLRNTLIAVIVGVTALVAIRAARPSLRSQIPSSQAFYDRNGKLLRLSLSQDDKFRVWFPLEKIAPQFVEAVLLKEDRNFRFHPGVNPVSLIRAAFRTFVAKGPRQGGSTLTMQLARLLYGIRGRSVWAKIRQIFHATSLEVFHSKNEILEAYLNLLPFGSNIEGIGAASLIYFHRDPGQIGLLQSLALVEVPQNPNSRGLHRATDGSVRRQAISRWLQAHPEDQKILNSAWDFQSFTSEALPFEAPHLVDWVASKREGDRVQLTIDLPTQNLIEKLVQAEVNRRKGIGIQNASVILLDSRSMEVQAYVGSAGYFQKEIFGQVNGAASKRSPGSTLKPFVFALAMDQGLIHENSVLKDSPTSFGAFDPENSDRGFDGPVTAKDALIRSRNIPAVSLFSQLKPGAGLYQLLEKAGVTRMKSEKFYGYALPLGGSELTLQELVGLYATILHQGNFLPIRLEKTHQEKPADPIQLYSPEAAAILFQMLTENAAPGTGLTQGWSRDQLPVAWKTGTSHGFRDAWSLGVFGPYVLGVWVGNFDGTGNPNFNGRDAAAPLFFRIVDAIRSQDRSLENWISPTLSTAVSKVKVCSQSGHLPGPHCKDHVESLFIPGKSPIQPCSVHRQYWISDRTGKRGCGPGPGMKPQIFEVWPSDILQIFSAAGLPRRKVPVLDSSCGEEIVSASGRNPQITSPREQLSYLLRIEEKSIQEGQTLPLTAITDGDAKKIHWFVDHAYLGESRPDRALFWPIRPGTHVVQAVDDQGRSSRREFEVTVTQ